MDNFKKAILKTLCYADIFDFPLQKDELYRFLIAKKGLSLSLFTQILKEMEKKGEVREKNGFYFLPQRRETVKKRQEQKKWFGKKIKIAQKVAHILKIVPWVKMVAVTGALALGNAQKEDDIDLLIVTRKGRLWTTRFLVTILVEIFAHRRKPGEKNVTDKICLNMFLDEAYLTVRPQEQDLFSAHEVSHLKPLWDRDNTYQKFLRANQWVRKFLPNIDIDRLKVQTKGEFTSLGRKQKSEFQIKIQNFLIFIFHFSLILIEKLLKQLQLFYMRRRRTNEVITEGILRFHPQDARQWVLQRYRQRVKAVLGE